MQCAYSTPGSRHRSLTRIPLEVYLGATSDAKQEGKMELLKDLETLIVMAVPTLLVVLAALVSIF